MAKSVTAKVTLTAAIGTLFLSSLTIILDELKYKFKGLQIKEESRVRNFLLKEAEEEATHARVCAGKDYPGAFAGDS